MRLDFDPASLRDWMAAVGLLRIVSETTKGRMVWRKDGRFIAHIEGAPDDLAARCAAWIVENRAAWDLSGSAHDQLQPGEWRQYAHAATGHELTLWCAVLSDGVMRHDGSRLQATALKYGFGAGGGKNWFVSMRDALARADEKSLVRVLAGERDETKGKRICRWDPDCFREHAYTHIKPSEDPMTHDPAVNALAAVGLLSCPSAPGHNGLRTPLLEGRDRLRWPIWTAPIRIADLDAALCCGSAWPHMQARWWVSDKMVYCVERGIVREPQVSTE